MKQVPHIRPLHLVAAFAVTVASTTAAGCEHVAFYSVTGGGSDDPSGGATTTTTTTQPGTTTATGSATSSVTRGAALKAVATCAASLYGEAAVSAAVLREAAAAAADSPAPEAKQAARDAWNEAIDRWQQAEMIHVGPSGPASLPGGKGMRDLVYSWPLVSRCLVEQALVAESYEKPDFFATAAINTRGLAAAEYLLFHDGTDNGCSAAASINSTGAWAALPAAELAARKAAYAKAVTADVAAKTKAIADAWSESGGNFAGELADAGQGSSLFKTDQLAMNAVTDGLFYLDSDVKDLKVGRPLGLVECAAATCPEMVESHYARRSRDHVRNNLVGFLRVLDGCDESGSVGLGDL